MKTSRTLICLIVVSMLGAGPAMAQWSLNGVNVYYNAGNVGIGTNNPDSTLEVRSTGPRAIFGLSTPSTGFNYGIYGQANSPQGRAVYALANSSTGTNFAVVGKTNSTNGFAAYFVGGKNYFHGRVGIGTTTPSGKLHVNGFGNDGTTAAIKITSDEDNGAMLLDANEIDSTSGPIYVNSNANGDVVLATGGGNVGIGTSSPQSKLEVNGTTRTNVLTITGGADLAEPFDITTDERMLRSGFVVAIDPEHPGKLRVADRAYDRTVAGIISGANNLNPGLVMSAEGSRDANGTHAVALTGRVWCWCDATHDSGGGAIEPGDMLTTAATAGHAMKVRDFDRAHGAVIGKAMTRLDSGRGLVLVLVNLQ